MSRDGSPTSDTMHLGLCWVAGSGGEHLLMQLLRSLMKTAGQCGTICRGSVTLDRDDELPRHILSPQGS